MRRGREDRLDRVAEKKTRAVESAAVHAGLAHAKAAMCAAIRKELIRAGIDPAQIPALRLAQSDLDEWANAGAIADCPKDASTDAGDDDELAAEFARKIGAMAQRYQDGAKCNFGNASLAELFAWSLAESSREARAIADGP